MYGMPQQTIGGSSLISSCVTTYTIDMFGFEGYNQHVHGCYVEMVKFFNLLSECIKCCQDTIRDVNKKRQDKAYIEYIYKKQVKKLMKSINGILDTIMEIDEEKLAKNNPILAGRKIYGDSITNLQHNYHNCTQEHLIQVQLFDYFNNKKSSQYTELERKLFLDDSLMIDKARAVIQYFDSIIPEQKENTKKVTNINDFIFFFQHFYESQFGICD